MADTVHEVVESIEEVFSTYRRRRMETLEGFKDLPDTDLRELRGQAQACKELHVMLRNAIGYTFT